MGGANGAAALDIECGSKGDGTTGEQRAKAMAQELINKSSGLHQKLEEMADCLDEIVRY